MNFLVVLQPSVTAHCANDMFRRNITCRLFSRLLCLVAAICAVIVPPGSAAQTCVVADQMQVLGQSCAASKKVCCCAPADEPRACECQRNSQPQEPKVPVSKPSERELTWSPWSAATAMLLTAENSVPAISLIRSKLSLPVRPSVQIVLCIWRI